MNYLSALYRAFFYICWFTAIPSCISICCFYFGFSNNNECLSSLTIPKNYVIFGIFIIVLNIIALTLVRIFKNHIHLI